LDKRLDLFAALPVFCFQRKSTAFHRICTLSWDKVIRRSGFAEIRRATSAEGKSEWYNAQGMTSNLQAPVLVLNANYEPLNICNTRRALVLIFEEKASLVMNGRGYIRTVSRTYPCPSIIRLNNMIRRPRPEVKLNKTEVFRRDGYICQYCGRHTPSPTIDHVIPRRLGGTHVWENLVTACSTCNHRKGGRTVDQAHMSLLKTPSAPPASAVYLFGKYLTTNDQWRSFVMGW
jgi:5-methylcytosine-specific restriction endonuclease McrA